MKDPAEFLEQHRDIETLDEKFRAEVIDCAQEWTRWYMNHLVAVHVRDSAATNSTPGYDGNFSKIFDTIASFLSMFESLDERMKKAAIIAPKLADLVDIYNKKKDGDPNRTETSSTIHIQLASDLIEKAANFAHLKSMNAQMNYQSTSKNNAFVPRSLEISQDVTQVEGASESNLNQTKSIQMSVHLESSSTNEPSSGWQQKLEKGRRRIRMKRKKRTARFQKSMTKHISGISANPFDDDWLGVTRDKVCSPIDSL